MKNLTAIALLLVCFTFAQAGEKGVVGDTRTIEKSFDVNADALVNVNAYESVVKISTWNQNKVQVKVTMSVEAWEEKDMETMFELLGADISGSATEVSVVSTTCIQQVNANDDRIKVRSKGMSAKVKSYKVLYEVKMPTSNHLNVKNRYGTVELGQHKGKLTAELYECELKAGEINATEAKLIFKYSNGTLGPVQAAELNLYESTLSIASGNKLKLDAKYSNVSIGLVNTLELSAYEGVTSIGTAETLTGSYRYGALNIGTSKKLNIEGYEMALTVPAGGEIELKNCKYSTVVCNEAKSINIIEAYESTFELGSIETIKTAGKYCEYKVLNLGKSLSVDDYESDVEVLETSAKFETIAVKGKYVNVSIKPNNSAEYSLLADLQYGDVEFQESSFSVSKYREVEDHVELEAQTKNNTGSASISVKGYETSLRLR